MPTTIMNTNTPTNEGGQTPTKEEIERILNDPATTQEAREDIMCHLTGILLAQAFCEDDGEEPILKTLSSATSSGTSCPAISHEGQPSGATSPENRPPWVILHLPHDSTDIPERVRDQFILTDAELARELLLMTDMHTGSLFEGAFVDGHVVRSPVSRLVLDVERFEDDHLEVMSSKGMGAIYTCTSHGHPLRRELSATEKNSLLADFYRPHHKCLTEATVKALKQFDKALILDAHSFPCKPRPYELDQNVDRPDICIGTDSFHTPAPMRDAFLSAFSQAGFSVLINAPFSGALVPSRFYQCDPRVSSIMVEVNRSIYMDESTGERLPTFDAAATRIRDCCRNAILAFD